MTVAARPVALVGPMGAGKTSVGRRLAKRLGLSFADTDALITRDHGPIADLFRDHGEEAFRAIERRTVADALRSAGVVSLGGGAVLDPATRADLAACTVVLLTVGEHAVADRLAGGRRPLLTDGLASWRRILAERLPLYESVADLTIDTSRRPMTRIVEELATALAASEVHASGASETALR